MNLRGVALIVGGIACACGAGADTGSLAGEGSDDGLVFGHSGSPASAGSGGGAGVDFGLEIAALPAAGNLQGAAWGLVSARALETDDGFQVRLYSEALPATGEFVPTRDYVRLKVPGTGNFELELAEPAEDVSAEFVICDQPGSPCLAAASTPESATGRILIQLGAPGFLTGGVNLSSGDDAIDGSFAGVERYPEVCAARACQCNGAQLERCSWDQGSWLPASCDQVAACASASSLQECCGGAPPNP